MKIFRSTLLVTATALFAAACGDKVVLPTTTTTTGTNISSVIVAPGSATLTVGQTANLTAAVTADAGVTYTIAWTSSDATKASVSSTGVVTALVATPGVAICAKATAAVGASAQTGCASIIVQGLANPTPASVSIASITGAGGLNFPVPVPPGVVAGQIDVRININPGTVKLDSVTVFINGKNAGTQVLTAAQAAALRSAADAAVAAQAAIPTVIISINTAAYNATTGAPSFLNGPVTVTAVGFGKQGSIAAAPSASNTIGLLFGNGDAWLVSEVIGATNTANSAAGFAFRTGSIAVSAIPVLYSGQSIGVATVNFGTAACDAGLGPQRTQALTAPATGTYAWTATFAKTAGAAAATNVSQYEFNAGCASNAGGGEGATVVASQYTNTNAGPAGFVGGSAVPVVRLDNRAPPVPAVFINPNLRQNGWLNDAAQFTTIQAAANLDGMITAAVVDAGVGGVTYAAKAGATLALANAAADMLTPATAPLAATLGNAGDCLVQFSQDALGNRSAAPAACATSFGVDRAAPTIAFSAGLASNARINTATVGAEFQVTVLDTGTVGNSGMLSGSAVVGTVILRNATASAAASCIVGTYAAATGCSPASVNAAPTYPLVPTTVVAAQGVPGYFTYVAVSRDAAGNSSAAVTRVIVHDNIANPPAVTFATPFLPGSLNASAASLSAVTSDDLDLRDYQWSFTYGATMGGFPIQSPVVAINAFNATPLINTSYNAAFSGSLMRQIQENGAAWTPGAAVVLSSANIVVRDQGGAVGTTVNTAVPVGTVNYTTAASTYAAAGGSNVWIVSNAATNVSDNGGPAAPTAALSVTLNADAQGTTAIFLTPFSRVDFYALNAADTQWVLIGSAPSPVTTDNGAIRQHRYSISWTPGTTFGLGAKSIRAIGVNAANDGFSTVTNSVITIINP